MTVNGLAAKRISAYAGYGLFGGCLLAFLITGVVAGVRWDRKPPTIQNASIPRTVHAGDNLLVHEHITVPNGCIPRMLRVLSVNRDLLAPDNQIQLLSDAAVIANGDVALTVPRDTVPRDWYYIERLSTAGCGPLSGIIAPDTTEMRAADGKPGVMVKVLAYSLMPDH